MLRSACAAIDRVSQAVELAQENGRNRFVIHYVPKRGESEHDREYGSNGLAWYQQDYYRLLSHRPDELGKPQTLNGGALANLIFPERVKRADPGDRAVAAPNRAWYLEKGIPWKRGWLLYGPPGTGRLPWPGRSPKI